MLLIPFCKKKKLDLAKQLSGFQTFLTLKILFDMSNVVASIRDKVITSAS